MAGCKFLKRGAGVQEAIQACFCAVSFSFLDLSSRFLCVFFLFCHLLAGALLFIVRVRFVFDLVILGMSWCCFPCFFSFSRISKTSSFFVSSLFCSPSATLLSLRARVLSVGRSVGARAPKEKKGAFFIGGWGATGGERGGGGRQLSKHGINQLIGRFRG